ncbi:putative universal stress protein [Chaetomium sp. MPI-SDFR-AT-0129]|nr:putative universal stress protein [Chaetomium sp. MPI-SDFR-AT-0129]
MAKVFKLVDRVTPSRSDSAKSLDSDVSPGTKAHAEVAEYFLNKTGPNNDGRRNGGGTRPFASVSTDASTTTLTSISEEGRADFSRQTSHDGSRDSGGGRKSSTASVTFQPPSHPSLPQGNPRKTDQRRLRASSPSPVSFPVVVGPFS